MILPSMSEILKMTNFCSILTTEQESEGFDLSLVGFSDGYELLCWLQYDMCGHAIAEIVHVFFLGGA